MPTSQTNLNRRNFIKTAAVATASLAAWPLTAQTSAPRKIKLGFDNFSLRGMGWKASQFLDYASAQKLDVLFFSDLNVFDSLEDAYLKDLKAKADRLGLDIHVGTYSICPTSKAFKPSPPKYETPEQLLTLAIRVAKTLGSPVVRCLIGNAEDRKVDGGIERQIETTVKVLKSIRTQALDAGLKIAVENHAGDMQAWELVQLMEAAGKDFVGATMDSGNAAWTLEDPLVNLDILGPYALTTGLRDSMIWETAEGATVQWTAMGEGNVDSQAYARRFVELCPQTPFILEIISGFPRPLPYLKPEFWKPYPKVRAHEFARFVALAKSGKPIPPFKAPAGQDRKEAEKEYQKSELERSLKYCKETLGLGLKA